MVQLKVEGPLIGRLAAQWGPSLSDCLEIRATFQKGVANKGTWTAVSIFYAVDDDGDHLFVFDGTYHYGRDYCGSMTLDVLLHVCAFCF